MDEKMTFQNDMFATVLTNPNSTLEDYVAHGLNTDNTGLLPAEEYKKLDKVQQAFTKDGVFDEESFNKAYLVAAQNYSELAEDDLYKKLEAYVEYSPYSRYAPENAKIKDFSPTVEKIKNPFEETYGLNYLYGSVESDKSMRELAQTNTHYFDWDKQEWIEESPDDFGISSLIKPAMTYAVWTEDGYHKDLETGQTVQHQKGEWKTDQNGKFYMETIGDREQYGLEVASVWDTLTSENTFINSINVFESDDKEKSVAGTTMKLIFNILPYCIPVVNKVWGAVHMAWGLASIMPTFYKSLEGFVLGGENKSYDDNTLLWQWATKTENWFKKYEGSISDEGRKSFWAYEQIGSMVGDIFSQIYEQRAAASFAGNLLNTEKKLASKKDLLARLSSEASHPDDFLKLMAERSSDIKDLYQKQSKLARSLSTGYMALTQSSDVYQQGLEAGYDRRAAGLTALMAVGFQYFLMSRDNSLGDWFLDKSTGYVKNSINNEVRTLLKEFIPDLNESIIAYDNAVSTAAKIEAKKGLAKIISKGKEKLNSLYNIYKNGTNDFLGNAAIESVEEVTEELAIDLAKGITDTLSWLGVWEQDGDYFKEGFFTEETFNRYLTSAVGGFVGGALFKAHDKYLAPLINGKVDPQTQRSLAKLVREGHTSEIISQIRKFTKSINVNQSVSSNKITINGIDVSVPISSKEATQADKLASAAISYVQWMDNILNQDGLGATDEEVIEKSLLDEAIISVFKESGLENFVLEDYKRSLSEATNTISELSQIEEGKPVPKQLKEKFKEQQEKVKDILTGKKSEYYTAVASMVLNENVRKMFDGMGFNTFVENYFNKKVSELSQDENDEFSIQKAKDAYEDYLNTSDIFKYIDTRVKVYMNLQQQLSQPIESYINSDYIIQRAKTIEDILAIDKYLNMKNRLINSIDFNSLQNLVKIGTDNDSENKQEYINLYEEINKGFSEGDLNVEEKITQLYNKVSRFNKNESLSLYNQIINNLQTLHSSFVQIHNSNILNKVQGISLDNLININWGDLFESRLNIIKAGTRIKSFKEYLNTLLQPQAGLTDEQKEKYSNLGSEYLKQILTLVNAPITYITEETLKSSINNIQTQLSFIDNSKQIQDLKNQILNTTDQEEQSQLQDQLDYLNMIEFIKQFVDLTTIFDTSDLNILKEVVAKQLLSQDKVDLEVFKMIQPIIESEKQILVKLLNNEINNEIEENSLIDQNELFTYIQTNNLSLDFGIEMFVKSKIQEFVNKTILNLTPSLKNNPKYQSQNLPNLKTFNFTQGTIDDEQSTEIQAEFLFNTVIVQAYAEYGKNFWDLSTNEAENIILKVYKQYVEFGPSNLIFNINPENPIFIFNPSPIYKLLNIGTLYNSEVLKGKNISELIQLEFKEKLNNPLYDFLNTIAFSINGKTNSVFGLLKEFQDSLNSTSLNSWILEKSDLESINEALKIIKITKGVVIGMIENDSKETPFGFNTAIKKYLDKYENGKNSDNYKLISTDQAKTILADLELLEQRLDFSNTLSTLQRNSQNSENLQITKVFERIASNFLEKVIEKYKPNWKTLIKTEDLNSDDKKLIALETLLYNEIGEDKDKFNQLLNLLNINIEEFSKKVSHGLEKNTTQFSEYDKLIYLTSVLSQNPIEFYNEHLQFVEEDTDQEKVPLYGQIRAAQVGKAFLKNKELFKELSRRTQNVIDCSELLIISAIGGAGKTSVVGKLIGLNNIQQTSKVFFGGPNSETANKLKENITELNITNSTNGTWVDILEKYIDSDLIKDLRLDFSKLRDFEDGKISNPKFKYLKEFNGYYIVDLEKISFKNNISDLFDYVFFDESTNIPLGALQIFNEISHKTGTKFVLFGDDTQMGERQTIEDVFAIRPIRLNFSMRDSNSLKKANNNTISNEIFSIQIANDQSVEGFVDKVKENQKVLKYYESEDNLIGEKIVKDVNTSIAKFKKIKESNPEATFMVVIDETMSDSLKTALDTIGFKENDDYKLTTINTLAKNYVQGREADYVIVDDIKYGEGTNVNLQMYEKYKLFYTMISRSLKGTLLINSSDSIKNDFNVISVEQNSFEPYVIFSKEAKKEAIKNFIDKQNKLLQFIESLNIQSEPEPEPEPEPKVDKDLNPIPVEEILISDNDETGFTDDSEKDDVETRLDTIDEIQENKPEEEPLNVSNSILDIYIHPFYNRIGAIQEVGNTFVPNDTFLDINIFKPNSEGKYDESIFKSFLYLKNLVSLNSKKTATKYINDSGINNQFKNSNFKIGDIKLRISRYNSKFDNPVNTFEKTINNNVATTIPLNDGDLFASLVREIEVGGKTYYITIAAFSKLSTIVNANSIDDQIKQDYADLMKYFATLLESKNSDIFPLPDSININEKEDGVLSIFNQITGIRINKAEQKEALTLNQLAEYGIQYDPTDIRVFEKNDVDEYLNWDQFYQESTPEEKEKIRNKLLDKNGQFIYRGYPYIIAELNPGLKQIIILTPKHRTFDQLLQDVIEIRRISSIDPKANTTVLRNRLLSGYDTLKLFFHMNNTLKSATMKENLVVDSLIKLINHSLSDLEGSTLTSSQKLVVDQWKAMKQFLERDSVKKAFDKNTFNEFFNALENSDKYTFFHDLKKYFTYRLLNMIVEAEGQVHKYYHETISLDQAYKKWKKALESSFKNKFYYSKTVKQKHGSNTIPLESIENHFQIRTHIQIPRYSMNLRPFFKIKKNTLNPINIPAPKNNNNIKVQNVLNSYFNVDRKLQEQYNKLNDEDKSIIQDFIENELILEDTVEETIFDKSENYSNELFKFLDDLSNSCNPF